jgi:hypothetical protein
MEKQNGNSNVSTPNEINLPRIIIKIIITVLIIIAVSPIFNSLGRLSLYNKIFKGRQRLPFGENSSFSYNLTLNNLDAMFASHIINGQEKGENDFRIVVIGDSSTWGILLKPEYTLSASINTGLPQCQRKEVKVFNLGYPTLSLTKDVLIAAYAMKYKPDLIIWPVTLESFPEDKQLSNPLVEKNLEQLRIYNRKFNLVSEVGEASSFMSQYLNNTMIYKRKEFADMIRLQFLGPMWSATGIDQFYPEEYSKAKLDLDDTLEYHKFTNSDQLEKNLAFYALNNMKKVIGNTPIVFINEPILISNGLNHDIRYNFYYPIWAYDFYRKSISNFMVERGWNYLDLWNSVPISEFTNSAIHLTPTGELIFANQVIDYLREFICYEN